MSELTVRDVPTMYSEMLQRLHYAGKPEQSRNGGVLTMQEPITVTVTNPLHRTLIDPHRDANPFFHVMEFIWMMSGSNSPEWIAQFNKRFHEYADRNNAKGTPLIHGAYGHRWRSHFPQDQLHTAINMLRQDPTTRRCVVAMWDASVDLYTDHNDLPCNTHLYFRVVDGKLDMTVANRSNDVVWGMTGANAVHMTMLQEVVAKAISHPIGKYRVFSVNAHLYEQHYPLIEKSRHPVLPTSEHSWGFYPTIPLVGNAESWRDFLEGCKDFTQGGVFPRNYSNQWLEGTAAHIYQAWMHRKEGNAATCMYEIDKIEDQNWRTACAQWVLRRQK